MTPLERFTAKCVVNPETGCWEWQAERDTKGYGRFCFPTRNRRVFAHRFAYEHHVGPVPDGLELDHLCRVRHCVNPAHLEPVTHAENMRRGEPGKYLSDRTHCPQGHPYDEANTYINRGSGYARRNCRKCTVAAGARYRKRKREAVAA